MKKLKHLLIVLLLTTPFLPQAQENIYTFDMSEFLSEMEMPWSIGNGTNPTTEELEGQFFEVVVYNGMNFNQHTLEIMNSRITVYGDTINSNEIIFKYFSISELVVLPETLSVPDEDRIELSMYPNPSVGLTTLKGRYIDKLSVYTIDGAIIMNVNVRDDKYELNTSNLSNGTYIIQVWLDNNQGTFKKLIVKN